MSKKLKCVDLTATTQLRDVLLVETRPFFREEFGMFASLRGWASLPVVDDGSIEWLRSLGKRDIVLNVAGPRESKEPDEDQKMKWGFRLAVKHEAIMKRGRNI